MSDSYPLIRYILAGKLTRQFTLFPKGQAVLDEQGGNLLYAASGLGLWDAGIGLIARVGKDYPEEWLKKIGKRNFDTRGIRVLGDDLDVRAFSAFSDYDTESTIDPLSHFSRMGIAVPKSLLGYNGQGQQIDSRTQPSIFTIRVNDIPADYKDGSAAHICAMDYLSHLLLTTVLREGQVTSLTLEAGENYMTPVFWDGIPALVKGLTAFMVTESRLRELFQGKSKDIWEMAQAIAEFGCETVVIKRNGGNGQYLYIRGSHERWAIPAYPSRMNNPQGAGDAFSGGFLAGYHQHYQPVTAAIYGAISASFAVEGNAWDYTLDAMSGLANARREALRSNVHRV